MKIPLEFYDQLRSQIRISDIVRQKVFLTKKGNEYHGLCPFHSEKTASFTVNDAKKFYHCFGCSAHGDVIRFVSETKGISYKEAAIFIAEQSGVELPKLSKDQERLYKDSDTIYSILELAEKFFVAELTQEARNYLLQRGMSADTIKKFSLGYAPSGGKMKKYFDNKSVPLKDLIAAGLLGRREDGKTYEIFHNRIMFPIRNMYNKIVGFGGRVMGDALPKYINSPETIVFKKGETMYGENIAISAAHKKNYSIIVEGYMDVIALREAGYEEAVAGLGTAVTEKHLQKLWRSGDEIIVCLDGDSAGIRASKRLINLSLPFITSDKLISFVKISGKSDPDDIIRSGGKVQFDKLLESKLPLSEMIWITEYENKNSNSAEAKASLEKKLENYCELIIDRSMASSFRRYFKDKIWNNVVRSGSKKRDSISTEVFESKNYTESEILEYALCWLIAKSPEILSNEAIKNFYIINEFNTLKYNDFKNWVVEEGFMTGETIEGIVKTSGFYDTFLVLSDSGEFFIDLSFIKRNSDRQIQIFEWLSKKYYLEKLKEEYKELIAKCTNNTDMTAYSYLEEIHKTTKELNKLNESFTD
jgi:DNA primase